MCAISKRIPAAAGAGLREREDAAVGWIASLRASDEVNRDDTTHKSMSRAVRASELVVRRRGFDGARPVDFRRRRFGFVPIERVAGDVQVLEGGDREHG